MMAPVARPSLLLGIVYLAIGRADGFRAFGHTPQAFLGSLAPLLAFPLVGGALGLAQGDGLAAIVDLLATVCALLAPPVIAFALAQLWRRDVHWLRYATAFNWCQWAIPTAAAALLLVLGAAMTIGLPTQAAGGIAICGLAAYGLWLHWFLARHGLALSGGRAVLLVLVVNLGTAALVVAPRLLAMAARGGPHHPA